ncbi:hypothetical protein DL767_000737 [Monosporascus sp. MG133]|nr:hypothetical protein DL767_000737 [Monosporascus sp. MG133]
MSAVAATVNESVPNGKVINLYYNTANAQAALSLRAGDYSGDDQSKFWAADINDYSGYILSPSEMATCTFRGINIVAAMTIPKSNNSSPATTNNISLVAPVYQRLTSTDLANKKVSMCSTGDKAWIYYLSGAAKGQVTLKEYDLVSGNNSTYLQYQDVSLNSSLAAWYNTKCAQRSVVYQELLQNHLKEFNVTGGQSTDIESTGNAKPLTSMAVTYYDGKAYLYYTDNSNNLCRVIKDGSVDNDDRGWGDYKIFEGSPKVATDSQLTVSSSHGINHIFYVSTDDILNFTHVRDSVEQELH